MNSTPHPSHDGSSAEDSPKHTKGPAPWEQMAASPGFRELLRSKTRFITVATVFFLVYYFALPVLSGYCPELMSRKVLGHFSLAYVFALSQFPMAWLVAAVYLRAAARFDQQAAEVVREHVGEAPKPAAGEAAR